MIDRAAGLLAQIAIAIAVGALLVHALRELWLAWKARRLATRIDVGRKTWMSGFAGRRQALFSF